MSDPISEAMAHLGDCPAADYKGACNCPPVATFICPTDEQQCEHPRCLDDPNDPECRRRRDVAARAAGVAGRIGLYQVQKIDVSDFYRDLVRTATGIEEILDALSVLTVPPDTMRERIRSFKLALERCRDNPV